MKRRAFLGSSLAAAVASPSLLAPEHLFRGIPYSEPGIIRLGSNENPLGVPESVRRAVVDALVDGNRYPRENKVALAAAIAARHGVAAEQITLGNGSAEILQMVVQALTAKRPGASLVIADPTFEDVEKTGLVMGAEVIKVPLRSDHSHDLPAMQRAADEAAGMVLVFICNPNNPTGTLTACDEVASWIQQAPVNVWFLVDEAYFEFVTDPSYRTFIPDALARPNLIVCRTLSKIYGMAGIRLGYAVAHADTSREINAFAAGTNINHLAIAGGMVALSDEPFVRKSLEVNAAGRDFIYRTLRSLELPFMETHANFVMHRINGALPVYIAKMLESGIRVGRAFPPLLNYNRVSIGLPSELEAWGRALRTLRAQGLA